MLCYVPLCHFKIIVSLIKALVLENIGMKIFGCIVELDGIVYF